MATSDIKHLTSGRPSIQESSPIRYAPSIQPGRVSLKRHLFDLWPQELSNSYVP